MTWFAVPTIENFKKAALPAMEISMQHEASKMTDPLHDALETHARIQLH